MNNEVKVVLNENKVKMMTKMAIYERTRAGKCFVQRNISKVISLLSVF